MSLARTRVAVTVAGPASLSGQGLFATWTNVLGGRGYVRERVVQAGRELVGATEEHDPLVVGVRVRLRPFISAELMVSPASARVEVRAIDRVLGNVAWLWDDARWAAFLLGGEWRRVRVAAGPLVVRSQRRLMNHLLASPDGTPYVLPIHEDITWNETAVGVLTQAAFTYPVTSHLFLQADARWRTARGHTPPLQNFAGAAFGLGGWSLGVALGVWP
jgi:hypothetical protein